MSDNRNDLPSVNSPNFSQRLRETIQTYLGRQGDPLERGLTLRDLLESGLAKLPSGFKLATGAAKIPLQPGDSIGASYEADLTPPPPPTGFTVSAGISHILIEHDAPLYRAGHGHLRTRVYGAIRAPGAAAPVFSDAIEVAQFSGTVYAHPTNPSTTWHLWIKWETADGVLSATPAGGTNGLVVRTGEDVSLLLDALTGELNESQLASSLRSRIDLIDGAMPGSVSARISSEAQQRVSADTALSTRIDTVQSSVNGNAAAIQAEASARANADAAEASARETLAARVTTAEGGIATNAAAIQTEASARATAIQAEAAKRETLQATVENNNITLTSAVQTEASTRATETGSLFAKYTVKVDVNGYVAGYGVAATSNDGVPSSEFIVVADKFAIAPVQTDNTANDGSPFFHRTVATTINGVTVPAGTYMKAAYIHDATITNAKIANLAVDDAKIATVSVDKLTAGSVSVGQYIQSTGYIPGQAGWRINGDGYAEFGFANIRGTLLASQIGADTITADKIDARGLVIKDALGNPIIQAGSAIDWSKLGGSAPNLSGLGYSGALDATKGAPAGTYVGNTLAENVESTAGAQAKVSAAQTALQAYTDAETAAAEVRAKAYADGAVTVEETRAIADAQAKADAARDAAINAAALDASNKATAAQTAAQDYAAAQAALAEVSAKAYADGVVDAEEARAIADAQAKADAAKDAAIAAAALDATTKSNAAQTAAQVYAAAQASLAEVTAKAYADGVVDAEEARAIADATAKANAAKDAAISAAAADATTKANNVKATVEAYAAAQAALAETQAKAYADGVVDAEEARAIADATAKAEAARLAAVNAAALDATDKANAAQSAAISSAATDATTKANAVLATSLQKAGDAITGPVTFLTNGGILAATDANNGVFMGPNGLVGKKAGNTTFAIDTAGNASFGGALNAATGTFSGTLSASAINAVNTVNLAGNAVTIPVSAQWANGSQATSSDHLVVQTASADFVGQPVFIFMYVSFNIIMWSGDSVVVRLYRGSTLIQQWVAYAQRSIDDGTGLSYFRHVAPFLDTPPAGSHTYRVTLSYAYHTTLTPTTSTLLALGTKR